MELEYTDEFKDAYSDLTAKEQRQIERKILLLANDYRHPSLQARKWEPPNTWYIRVNSDIRLFYEVQAGFYRLITVGHHDIGRSR